MAGILSLLGMGDDSKSLAERKALAKAALSGEYLPKEGAVTPRATPAGLLGADPVSIQGQPAPGVEGGQGRIGQPQGRLPPGSAMAGEYLPREGGVAPQGARPAIGVDPVSVQGGGGGGGRLPPGAQGAISGGEVPRIGGPAAANEIAQAGSKGLLGRVAGILGGPVSMGAQLMLTPGELGNGELSDEQRLEQVQGQIPDAAKYASHVRDLAKSSAGIRPQVLPTPNGQPAAAPQPAVAPQASPEQQHAEQIQAETKRQTIQTGTLKGLQTGAVSRPELASTIVEQKAQQEGTKLTPDAKKSAVSEELATMKTMDDNSLSKYVGYAIMAAGLVAAVTDKTGRTGEAAFKAFDNQLQRQATQRQQQAALAYQKFKDERQYGLDNRKVGVDEKKVDVDDKYNTGRLAGDAEDRGLKKELGLLDVQAKREATSVSAQGNSVQERLGLLAHEDRRAALDADMEGNKLSAAAKIRVAKINAGAKDSAAEAAAKGEAMPMKDAVGLVKAWSKGGSGVKLDDATIEVFASRARNELRNNPNADTNEILKEYAKSLKAGTKRTWLPDTAATLQ
jgi:hypothetical protein